MDPAIAGTAGDRPWLGRDRRGVARAAGVRQPPIAEASWISWSFSRPSTTNSATSNAARARARADGVAHMRAPDGEALALAFVEVTAAHPFQGGDNSALGDYSGSNVPRARLVLLRQLKRVDPPPIALHIDDGPSASDSSVQCLIQSSRVRVAVICPLTGFVRVPPN